MNIVIFSHPLFFDSQSMPRYTRMLAEGMKDRGHNVEIWTASPFFFKLPAPFFFKKWLGYFDQFVSFPMQVKGRVKNYPKDTLFVFSDQALGPWVPLIIDRPHVIHCHDFLAQQSALNQIRENKVSLSGKLYQAFIRRGYQKGKFFISVSNKTREDLHHFLKCIPRISETVYNGFNQNFIRDNLDKARNDLNQKLGIQINKGYILHVGGNLFYKNRKGVLEIYISWRNSYHMDIPLLMIGEKPTEELNRLKQSSPFATDIHFLTEIDDSILKQAYQGATLLLFPSLAEGFGWPIAEAMASGCLVVTTNEAPMKEVGEEAAFYIQKRPYQQNLTIQWAKDSAAVMNQVIVLSKDDRQKIIDLGIENVKRFDTKKALDQIEVIYKEVLDLHESKKIKNFN